jgi:hypothetical protein
MASLDDIATIQKNGVIAVNTLNQTLQRIYGSNTSATASANTLVLTGPGRLINVSVTVAGTTDGAVHNSSTVAGAAASNMLATITNTVGVYPMNLLFTAGLVIVVGTGQEMNVTYSVGA